MPFFDDVFYSLDANSRQFRDIERLKFDLESAQLGEANAAKSIRRLARRVEKLELMNRTLLEVLLAKKLCSRDDLEVMMQQIDLLDGVEDGRISADVHAKAPTCGTCGRFVNPQRTACVYCDTPVKQTAQKRPPQRTVTCSSCATTVLESSTYFGESGVVCSGCFSG